MDENWFNKLENHLRTLEATYIDPAVSQLARSEGRKLGQYYSSAPASTEDVKKYGGIRATRASDEPAESLGLILGMLPQGALAKAGGLAMAQRQLPFGKNITRTVDDIPALLEDYQRTTKDAQLWLRGNEPAFMKELGYVEGQSIPRNLRNVRNSALEKFDSTIKDVLPPIKELKHAEGWSASLDSLPSYSHQDDVRLPKDFVDHISQLLNQLPENQLPHTPRSRTLLPGGSRQRELLNAELMSSDVLDYLQSHRANILSLDDPMVAGMLHSFENPRTTPNIVNEYMKQLSLPYR